MSGDATRRARFESETLQEVFSADEPGRRGEILAAALEVFAESGYDRGSMRSIAERVGVTEPALYRHFPGKEAILAALMRLVTSRLRDEVIAAVSDLEAGMLREQILAGLRSRRRVVELYAPLFRILLPVATRDERLRSEYRKLVIVPVTVALTLKAAEVDDRMGVADAEATRESRVRSVLALVVGYIASSFVLGDQPEEAIVDAALRVMRWEG